MELHKGHRERLKNRYAKDGIDSFEEHNVLEMLLFYSCARVDTNPIAHRLLNKFGSISGVLNADIASLKSVEGVGENTALFLKLIRDISDRYVLSGEEKIKTVNSTELAGKFLMPYFRGCKEEKAYLLCLDKRFKVLSCSELSSGNTDSVSLSLRKTMEAALVSGCCYVILSHNHTSGVALPSRSDLATTNELSEMLRPVGVKLIDHLIFGADNDYVSMLESGLLGGRSRPSEEGYTVTSKKK